LLDEQVSTSVVMLGQQLNQEPKNQVEALEVRRVKDWALYFSGFHMILVPFNQVGVSNRANIS
jgi:hypothetical protein